MAGNPPAAAPEHSTVPGGWVSVLADCLEERAPGAWSVVDRTVAGDTAASARTRLATVRGLKPAVVVVGVGARELADPASDVEAFRREVNGLVQDLVVAPAPRILIVGVVPPTLAQLPAGGDQAAADARTARWNAVLGEVAKAHSEVAILDLWTEWPRSATRSSGSERGLFPERSRCP